MTLQNPADEHETHPGIFNLIQTANLQFYLRRKKVKTNNPTYLLYICPLSINQGLKFLLPRASRFKKMNWTA